MQTTTLDFPRNARRVYTAVKHVFQTKTRFGNIDLRRTLHGGGTARLVRVALHGECQGEGGGTGDGAEPGDDSVVIPLCPQPPQLRSQQAKRDATLRLHSERGLETGGGCGTALVTGQMKIQE